MAKRNLSIINIFLAFKGMSIRKKIVFVFLFISIIPISILQLSTHSYLYSSMKEKIGQISKENLKQTEKNLDMVLAFYNDMLIQISTDNNIIEQTRKIDSGTDQERYLAMQHLQTKLVSLANSRNYIKSIAIIGRSGSYVVFDKDTLSYDNHVWGGYPDIRKTSAYTTAFKSNRLAIENAIFYDKENNKYNYLLHLSLRLCDLTNINSQVGVAVMSIDESALSDACNYPSSTNEGDSSNFTFIVNKEGSIVSYPVKENIGDKINLDDNRANNRIEEYRDFIIKTSVIKTKNMIINEIDQPMTGWTIINVVDQDNLFRETRGFQNISLALGILVMVFSIIIILYVLRTISKSINEIIGTMKEVQSGDLLVQVRMDTHDEISIIGDNFNLMMKKINHLIFELKHQMKLTYEASDRQRKAEIMALEAQINPHFLYNTLDSINWYAIEKKEYEISKMLKSLAQILRYSVSKSISLVEISEELEWLKRYIYLQKIRFDNSFECQIEVDDSILHKKIHKLILQPFVENAIVHGFEGVNSGGILTISMKPYHDLIRIVIEDNGCGIRAERLSLIKKFINEGMFDEINTEGTGMGVYNVIGRIKMYYGDSVTINIDNRDPTGTRITLIIPALEG